MVAGHAANGNVVTRVSLPIAMAAEATLTGLPDNWPAGVTWDTSGAGDVLTRFYVGNTFVGNCLMEG